MISVTAAKFSETVALSKHQVMLDLQHSSGVGFIGFNIRSIILKVMIFNCGGIVLSRFCILGCITFWFCVYFLCHDILPFSHHGHSAVDFW